MKHYTFLISQIITIVSIVGWIFFEIKSKSLAGKWDQLGPGIIAAEFMFFCIFLFICWSIYYLFYARDSWSHAYIYHILTVLILSVFLMVGFQKISKTIEDTKYTKKYAAWYQRAQDKEYISKKLNISFQYITEDFPYGPVTVKESDDAIQLYVGGSLSGMIQLHKKDKNTSLIEALRNDFKNSSGIPIDASLEYAQGPEYGLSSMPDSYSSIKLDDNNVRPGGIIDFPPYPYSGSYNKIYAVMDAKNPDKYIIVISGRYDIDASKLNYGKSWMSTIRFLQ